MRRRGSTNVWKKRAAACGLVLLSAGLCTSSVAVAEPIEALPETPPNHIVDLADVVNAGVERQLNGVLRELEDKTGVQYVVLTIRSTEGRDIREYALAVLESSPGWRLGQADEDNGLLTLVAVGDRKFTTEVGYGLEPILPDGFVGGVQRSMMVPAFRKGDYSGGIRGAVLAIVERIRSKRDVPLEAMPALPQDVREAARNRSYYHSSQRSHGLGGVFGCMFSLFPLLLVIAVVSVMLRAARGHRSWGGGYGYRRRAGMPWWMWMLAGGALSRGMGHRHRSGWGTWSGGGSSFGGFGGGGFGGGGFGGGGGGSFGGGGASGGW